MKKFIVQKFDPTQYRAEILEFWKNYLPGTPVERFDWMNNNPDGKPVWYLALEEDGNKLVGTVSVMPRIMCNNGETVCAGIVGDFMVSSSSRVFGPALTMQKKVVSSYKENNLDFIYTLPNMSALKIGEKAGLNKIADLYYYVKPISATYYLAKHINASLANLVSPLLVTILKLATVEPYILSKGYYREVNDVDDSFDEFWECIKTKRRGLVGNHSAEYIRWRYFKNPEFNFRIITYQETPNGEILGYLVFTISDNIMEIYDLIGLQKNHENKLIKKAIRIARDGGNRSINFRLSERTDYFKQIKYFGFFRTKCDVCVLSHGMGEYFKKNWVYMEGDRNI